jgi:carboxyl-terminal processing protease
MINNIRENYIYLADKDVDIECIRESYLSRLDNVKTRNDLVLFFEYLLDEFYDSHLILNTNINTSFRLHSPVYAKTENGKTLIIDTWYSKIKNLKTNIVGAEILEFNGREFNEVIDSFPTVCHNKTNDEVRNWIGNKILAGRYNEPRILKLKLRDGQTKKINLDDLKMLKNRGVLSSKKIDKIGIIRVNNSLNEHSLISKFDKALNSLMDTEGLIIDLRNTIDGGRCDVAIGILGRFIEERKAYQNVVPFERHIDDLQPDKKCIYVDPRLEPYSNPVVVLVGRWTGSMGEGIAMGFDGLERADIVGTEMRKLLGGMYGYSIKDIGIKYNISREKTYHLNGTSRQDYVPNVHIVPSHIKSDVILEKGIELIKSR